MVTGERASGYESFSNCRAGDLLPPKSPRRKRKMKQNRRVETLTARVNRAKQRTKDRCCLGLGAEMLYLSWNVDDGLFLAIDLGLFNVILSQLLYKLSSSLLLGPCCCANPEVVLLQRASDLRHNLRDQRSQAHDDMLEGRILALWLWLAASGALYEL
jgi:hypothetical protein